MAWRDLKGAAPQPRLEPPAGAVFGLRVLASGSSGNATLLYVPGSRAGMPARLSLIDAGLSPTRTRALLAADGLRTLQIDDIIYTHLDRDHAHLGWRKSGQCRAVARLHRRHISRAEREGHAFRRTEPFEDVARLGLSVTLETVLSLHDRLGVSVLRFTIETERGRATLGFATDVGSVERAWTDHLAGVDALAIESNYCPELQTASDRPAFLKARIMGGAGHLSNGESARAASAIGPRTELLLLHLSRQCNTPARAVAAHGTARGRVTVSSQERPTQWIWVHPSRAAVSTPCAEGASAQLGLFEGSARRG